MFLCTNFDFRVIDSSLEKFNIDKTIWDSVNKVDLFHEVKKRVILPLKHYDLKTVSDYFDYEKVADLEDGYDGLRASMDYYKYFKNGSESEKEEMKEKLVKYNTDDILRVIHIFRKLESIIIRIGTK